MSALQACPCASGSPLEQCCAPLIRGTPAANAEALMRSRYSAYALGLADYVLATWHPSTRPTSLNLDPLMRWIGLEVKRHEHINAEEALVEFIARCKVNGRAHRMQELSRFVRENGRWFYVSAENQSQ